MTAVTDITPIAHITCPSALRDLPGWVIWRFEPNGDKKPRKVPFYTNGGRRHGDHGSREDRAQLTTFDAARAAAARRKFDGIGLALLPEFNLVALDFDDCIAQGRIHPEVLELLSDTYAERSPSGNGIRAFFQGQLGNRKSHKAKGFEYGVETFSTNGFVTFTGQVLDIVELMGNIDTVAPINTEVTDLMRRRFKRELEAQAQGVQNLDVLGLTSHDIGRCLTALPPDLDYDTWLMVGMAIHHETSGTGFDMWDTWSQASSKYSTREYNLERWNSFGKSASGPTVTARSLVHLANEHGAGFQTNGPASAEEFDEVAQEVAQAQEGAPAKPNRFTPLSLLDFTSQPAPEWIIKGVLPKAALVVLYGESGSGKSFVALDMAMAIARGIAWRDRRVCQGRVVYIAAEGAGGFRNRCVAYLNQHCPDGFDIPLEIIPDAPNLLMKDEALQVARGIGKADVVVVDTFAQVTPGGNENAGEDVGKALAHCKGIHRATGAVVLLVHHSGKDASKGARGWSGLRAAADAELEVSKSPGGRMLRTTKQKDGADDLAWGFGLDEVSIGMDSDGEVMTSMVVVEKELPTARVLKPMGAVETLVNAVIQEMAKAQTSGIEVAAIVTEAVKKLDPPEDGKRDTRKQRVRRAIETLCSPSDDTPYWLHDDGTIEII